MKYKIETLDEVVKCEDIKFPDIASLKFGTTPSKIDVFDVTAYCEDNKIDFDFQKFSSKHSYYIDLLIENKIIDANNIVFIAKGKQVLMVEGLEQLFLSYVNKELYFYFSQIIESTLENGFSISDGLLTRMVIDRVPSNILEDIVKSRNEESRKQG